MTQIKLIEKQSNIFRLQIGSTRADLHLKPLAMYTTDIFPITPKVKGSTLGWNIAGCFVSYQQIKRAILLMLLFAPLLSTAQIKPIGSIYGTMLSRWEVGAGIEAGAANIGGERLSMVGFAHYNTANKIDYGAKAYMAAIWLDTWQECFVAPVIGVVNTEQIKGYRYTLPVFGIRYQVYGGFGELMLNNDYISFKVGYQFGNSKRRGYQY